MAKNLNIMTAPVEKPSNNTKLFANVGGLFKQIRINDLKSFFAGVDYPDPGDKETPSIPGVSEEGTVFVNVETENDAPEEGETDEVKLNADLLGGNSPSFYGFLDEYSYDEKRIGTWIDGKPLYRRMLRHAASGTNLNFPCGIENWEHMHLDIGNSFWTGTDGTVSYSLIHQSFIKDLSISMASGNIILVGMRDLTGYIMYFSIIYTKTTDTVR